MSKGYAEVLDNLIAKLWTGSYKEEHFEKIGPEGSVFKGELVTIEIEQRVMDESRPFLAEGISAIIGIAGGIAKVGKGKPDENKTGNAQNTATYPKLKEQLAQENLRNIAARDSRLAKAVSASKAGNRNFSIGIASRIEADRLGKIWVGDGAKQISNGGWISHDGTRVYRPPTPKKSVYAKTGVQANFETYQMNSAGNRVKISNGHLNITD